MRRHSVAALAILVLTPAVAWAAQRDLEKTWRVPVTAGEHVIVDGGNANVTVRVGDVLQAVLTAQLHISGVSEETADSWLADNTPRIDNAKDHVRITVTPFHKGLLSLAHLTAHADLSLVAPISVVPDITTRNGDIKLRGDFPSADPLRLRSADGKIEMTGAAISVDVRTTGGDARVEVVRPLERLFARTANGDVTLTGGAREVHVDTASGDVWLNNLSGDAEVATSSGKITLHWDRLDPSHSVRIRATKGVIQLIIPDDVKPQGELRTTTGTIRCDLPAKITEEGRVVTLEGDGPRLDVESATGEIVLSHRDEGWEASPAPLGQ
ncbi:MAG: DUF4097 domain-containing protein [Acidobacteria bacterium]|nr:DUF4097 domain-containing protein [Acidobacteriota bacterium]